MRHADDRVAVTDSLSAIYVIPTVGIWSAFSLGTGEGCPLADVAPNYQERREFWKPVVTPQAAEHEESVGVCAKCGTPKIIGARFCHVCGLARRSGIAIESTQGWTSWLGLDSVRRAIGLTTAPLVAFVLGCGCVGAAAIIGLAFTASTALEWQAIQLWRIEWLLAAVALFGAGILLKKKN